VAVHLYFSWRSIRILLCDVSNLMAELPELLAKLEIVKLGPTSDMSQMAGNEHDVV